MGLISQTLFFFAKNTPYLMKGGYKMFKNKLDKNGLIMAILIGMCGYACFEAGKAAGGIATIDACQKTITEFKTKHGITE